MKVTPGGFIYCSAFDRDWSQSMTAIPTPRLMGELIRIYYYSKDGAGDGRISYIEVSAANPSEVIYIHPEPVLDIGEPGDFDDCGVCPSCFCEFKEDTLFYFFGVTRLEKLPYAYFAGLAREDASGVLKKQGRVPVLERTNAEPHLRSACTVLPTDEGGLQMIYVSGSGWFEQGGKRFPRYVLRSASSNDGVNWMSSEDPVIPYQADTEFGFGRPWMIRKDGVIHLFYSLRSTDRPYRIGYARSTDGKHFTRMDELIELHPNGEWDAQMMCYPAVLDTPHGCYLFYNGNGYGASGFGYLKLSL